MQRYFLALGAAFALSLPCLASAATFAYVQTQDKVLQVIDIASRATVATLPIPGLISYAVASHPNGNEAYLSVLVHGRAYVAVVETATHTFAKAIPVDSSPSDIVFNASGSRAYVSHEYGSTEVPYSTITEIDTATREVLGTMRVESREIGIAVAPNGHLYVARTFGSAIDVIDPQTRQTLHTFATPNGPRHMAFDATRGRLYVGQYGALQFDSTVSVFDIASRAMVGSVSVGFRPGSITLSRDGSRAFVSVTGAVRVIDTSSLTLEANVPIPGNGLVLPLPSQQALLVVDMARHQVLITDEGDFGGSASVPVPYPARAAVVQRNVTTTLAQEPQEPELLSGLWWNPAQSGWGLSLTQRRNILFAAWFTYRSSQPRWFVMPSCVIANATCTGTLYETSYETPPGVLVGGFQPEGVRPRVVGTMTLSLHSPDQATMSYVVDGNAGSSPLSRQLFASPTPSASVDYTDLWWNPLESGMGLSITHQSEKAFLAWFRYSMYGRDWIVSPDCVMNPARTACRGPLYETGGGGNAWFFDPAGVTSKQIGEVEVTFMGPNTAVVAEHRPSGDTRFSVVRRQVF